MITSTTVRQEFNCNGSVKDFVLTMPFIETDDILVFLKEVSTGILTALVEGTDYSIASPTMTFEAGGTLTTDQTYISGYHIVAVRRIDMLQLVNYIEGDAFPAETHERALDKLTMIAQQLDEQSVNGPAASTDGNIVLFDGATGGKLKQSVHDEDDLNDFRTHADGDGSDHADVALSNAHRLGDGTDHSHVALNDAHRVSTATPHVTAGEKVYWNEKMDAPVIHAQPQLNESTELDEDLEFPVVISPPTTSLRRWLWGEIKAKLKAYFDTLYNKYVHPNHSGDVTSVGDGAQTIANKAVTLAKLDDVVSRSAIARPEYSNGVPSNVNFSVLVAGGIDDVARKEALVNNDTFGLNDSEETYSLKKTKWLDIKAVLKTYFDPIYAAIAHNHAASAITSGNLDLARLPTGGSWTLSSMLSILAFPVKLFKELYCGYIQSQVQNDYYVYLNTGVTIEGPMTRIALGTLTTDGGGNWDVSPGGTRYYWAYEADGTIVLIWEPSATKWVFVRLFGSEPFYDEVVSSATTPPAFSQPNHPPTPAWGSADTYLVKKDYLWLGSTTFAVLYPGSLYPRKTEEYLYVYDCAFHKGVMQGKFDGAHTKMPTTYFTDSHTLDAADAGAMVRMNKTTATVVTIPSGVFDAGTLIHVAAIGSGTVTITAAGGVSLNGVTAGSGLLWAQYSVVTLYHISGDTWLVFGAIGVVA